MSITTRTRDRVARLLQERGVGRGLTIAQIRRHYPARAVRRTSVLQAIRDLEAMGKVAWNGNRVRWASAEFDVERVMGVRTRDVMRDRSFPRAERVQIASELSEALLPGRAGA